MIDITKQFLGDLFITSVVVGLGVGLGIGLASRIIRPKHKVEHTYNNLDKPDARN